MMMPAHTCRALFGSSSTKGFNFESEQLRFVKNNWRATVHLILTFHREKFHDVEAASKPGDCIRKMLDLKWMHAWLATAAVALLLANTGCSNSSDDSNSANLPISSYEISTPQFQEVTGPGVPSTSAGDLSSVGYLEREFLMMGTAQTYSGTANVAAKSTGASVPYTTRILVRAPADPSKFSGRVLVEPFNTSGPELDAVWELIHEVLTAHGDVWIGVTERAATIPQLQHYDGARYAALNLPSNDLAWDILSQVGIGVGSSGAGSPLGELKVAHIYMSGYSQSGIETATYASAISEGARVKNGTTVYDGFLVMGRSGSMTPLESGVVSLPAFEHIPLGQSSAPIVDLETQTDVQGFETTVYSSPSGAEVRRSDANESNDRYRLREIAGAPHAAEIPGCGAGSTFPVPAFARAAWAGLVDWVEADHVPAEFDVLATDSIGPVSPVTLDEYGNARGGARSPWIDVPLSTYAANSPGSVICQLVGLETPFDPATVAGLYTDANDYNTRFTQSLDKAIENGLLLQSERQAILDKANARAMQYF
jgi:hypothetical protein